MKTMEPALSLSLKNILLATDFSPGSETALRYAQAIAHRHGSRVHTIHVSGPDSYQLLEPDAFALTFNGPAGSSGSLIDVLHGLLEGLPSQVPLRQGAVWEVVSDVVKRSGIDLLVLASHGRHGIPRLILGSVAEELFRNVSCPVLTVGPDVKECSTKALEPKKVLLATHLEPFSAATQYAGRLCNEFQAELTVLHVADERRPAQLAVVKEEVTNLISAALGEELSLWRKPKFLLEHGLPSAKILEVARQLHPDLMVLGARHPEPAKINSHLPWATAARVIAEAPCPVLTIRQRNGYDSR